MRGQNNSQPLGSVRRICYAKITLSLILLFNISLGVLDLLFDFVAYFILASQLKEAARRATYFAEATDALRKLALLNLLSISSARKFQKSKTAPSRLRVLLAKLANAPRLPLLLLPQA